MLGAATALLATAWLPEPSNAAEPQLPEGLAAPAKPAQMPAFELPTVDGKRLRSQALDGQVLVIRFWASW